MMGSGFFVVNKNGSGLHYAVDIKESYVGVAVFERVSEGVRGPRSNGEVIWAELQTYLEKPFEVGNRAGFVDLYGNGVYVPDLPGVPNGGVYKGRSYIFADGMNGLDEMVDYSILDIVTDNAGFPQPWSNRFAGSAKEKVDYSFRFRAKNQVSNALVVFMAFDTGSFFDCRIELLCDVDPILLNNTDASGFIEDATIPKDGIWFKQWFYTAQSLTPDLKVTAGGSVDIPFKLTWNKDGSDCNRATRFKAEANAGYLPKTRAFTDAEGRGMVRVQALGLEAGDRIKVKLNAEHYTSVGSFTVEVV